MTITDAVRSFPDGDGGKVRAVDGVSLSFDSGEVTAILGPNGAGKTALRISGGDVAIEASADQQHA